MATPLSYIEISKNNLIHNIETFRSLLAGKTQLVAVVKANAYGHGLKEIVMIAEKYVDYFQVDDIEELRQLRQYSQKQTLVFGYVQQTDLQEAVDLNGTLGVYSKEILNTLNQIGEKHGKKVTIHLKVDALLGRQGILVDEVHTYGEAIKNLPHIDLLAIYSHFSDIEDTENLAHAKNQHQLLLKAKQTLQHIGFPHIVHHMSATSGLLSDLSTNWGSALVRLGIGMYGQWPSTYLQKKLSPSIYLRPVLRWVTHLAQVKQISEGYPVGYGKTFISKKSMTIGIVPQGYSDGYDRKFSNNGFVLVQGKQCPIIGRIAMNMFVVDLGRVKHPKVDDEVVILGKQGNEEITAEMLAESIGAINYEIVARVSSLLPRVKQ